MAARTRREREQQAFLFVYDHVEDPKIKSALDAMLHAPRPNEGIARTAWQLIRKECGWAGPEEDQASLVASFEQSRRDLLSNLSARDWPLQMSGIARWV